MKFIADGITQYTMGRNKFSGPSRRACNSIEASMAAFRAVSASGDSWRFTGPFSSNDGVGSEFDAKYSSTIAVLLDTSAASSAILEVMVSSQCRRVEVNGET